MPLPSGRQARICGDPASNGAEGLRRRQGASTCAFAHTGGLTSTQLDQHGALGLVHLELEGFDCIQKAEDELVRSSQVGLATDNAMHREVIGIPWKKISGQCPSRRC